MASQPAKVVGLTTGACRKEPQMYKMSELTSMSMGRGTILWQEGQRANYIKIATAPCYNRCIKIFFGFSRRNYFVQSGLA